MAAHGVKCPNAMPTALKYSHIKSRQNSITSGVIAKIVKLHVKWPPFFKMAAYGTKYPNTMPNAHKPYKISLKLLYYFWSYSKNRKMTQK